MRIVELSYSLASGGGERFVVDLSNKLAENPDNEVVLLVTNTDKVSKFMHYKDSVSKNVKLVSLGCDSGQQMKSFWKVLRYIQKNKPDIVHAHCSSLLLFLPALFARETKYVHTLHNLAQKCLKGNWHKVLNKFFYRSLIQPVTISPTCYKSYIGLYGKGSVVNVTNGREPVPVSKGIKKDSAVPTFVHVARCASQKNQGLLFRTMKRLYDDGYNFKLMVLGAGFESSEYMQYDALPYINIIGESKQVGDYMAQADFFILSSVFEGLPLTLLEAMSVGCIPVSTPAGGVVDVVCNRKNGFISKDFSDDAFYQTVKEALENLDKINRQDIIREYNENYSMDVCANKYYEVYKHILGQHR